MNKIKFTYSQQPPVITGVDWSNPLSKGLIDVIETTRGVPRSLLLGTTALTFGTSPTPGINKRGKCSDSTAAFGGYYFQRSDGKYAPGGDQTFVYVGQLNSSSGLYAGIVVAADGSGSANALSMQDSASGNINVYYNNTANILWGAASAAYDGNENVLVLCAISAGTITLYKNGSVVTTASAGVTTIPSYGTSRLVIFGERVASATYASKGKCSLVLHFGRALSEAEVKAISANPWQLFQPITKPLFVPLNTEVYSGTIYTVSLTDTTTYSDTGSSVIFEPQLASQLDSLATVEGTVEDGSYALSQTELLNQFDGCTVITISADTQVSVPDADVSVGSWTSSNAGTLVSALDETSYDDADYIYTTSTGSCTISVAGTQDPQRSTGHYIKYRLLNGNGNVTVQLIVESTQTVIASWGPHVLSGSPQDFTQTLTAGEADSITNYGDLAIKIIAS